MRILAIRGKNLASLYGGFEVDLDAGPLGGAGLFAITGQTGAGKSTLLDAMCLALFDRTPRLSARSKVDIGRDEDDKKRQSGESDPRSILRRGESEGFAEVDFAGVDERRYRAKWSVRRARGKAEGALQPAALELWDLSAGKALHSDKKTETLVQIEERLGLGFEQFRRSVLLPQGEFAAFLKADEKDRAELLERMTGTGIYSQISIAAWKRSKDEEKRLDQLQQQLGGVIVLGPEEAEALQARLEAAREEQRAVAARAEALQGALRWHDALAGLQRQEEAAAADAARRDAEVAELEPVRVELAALAAVEALRPLLAAGERAAAALAAAEDAAGRAEIAFNAATAEAEAAGRQDADAQAALVAEQARQESLSAALAEATRLDAEIAAAARSFAQARQEATAAEESLQRAEAELAAVDARLAAAIAASAEESSWIAANIYLAPLVAGWDRHARSLDRLIAFAKSLAAADAVAALHAARQQAADAAVAVAATALEAHREGQVLLAAALEVSEAELAALGLDARQAEREALHQRRRDLERWLARAAERDALLARLDLALKRAEDAAFAAADAERAAEAAAKQAQRQALKLEGVEESLVGLREKEKLAGYRAKLKPGEPCPLCGSPDHPLVGESDVYTSILSSINESMAQLREGVRREESARQQALAEAQRYREASAAAAAEAASLDAQRQALAARGEDPLPSYALREDLAAVEAALAENQAALGVAAGKARALEAGRATLRASQARLEAAAAAARGAEREQDDARRAGEAHAREGERLREQAAAAREALMEALSADQLSTLDKDPAGFLDQLEPAVRRYEVAQRGADAAAADLARLHPEREVGAARLRERYDAATQRKAAQLDRQVALSDLQAARQAQLGGQETAPVQAALKQALAAAQGEAEQARRRREAADHRWIQAGAQRQAAADALLRARAEADAASGALASALAQAGLTQEEARGRLLRPAAWADAQRQRVADALSAQQRAAAVLEERRRQRLAHQQLGAPDLAADAAGAALADARAAAQALTRDAVALEERLRQDAENRERSSGLVDRRDTQRRVAEHWGVMSKLIGSADGKIFRQFAQSLTLDALLVQANHHLRGLTRRYSLMRIPGEDLHLQIVDHYHGSEVRSVNSLSGGESFLVSLALALGLATLSAKDARIGSLFIDEGFGTLDPDTLDVALSSLDALQASGRQIGLISHVPGMAERVGVQVQVVPRGGGRSSVRVVEHVRG